MIDGMSSLLLRQVRVVPLDGPAAADPVDVLIEDGVITGLGPAAGSHRVPAVTVPTVEGEGRWLIPGLWDAHVHLGQWALSGRRLDLSQTSSPEAVLTIVAQAARDQAARDRAAQDRRPIVGMGHRADAWHRQVTVAELDAACAEVPVALINSDCHHGWLNSAALDALGLPRRDTVVAEAEWFAAYPLVVRALDGPPTSADYRQRARRGRGAGRGRPCRLRVQRAMERLGTSAGTRAVTSSGSAGRRIPTSWTASARRGCAADRPCPVPANGAATTVPATACRSAHSRSSATGPSAHRTAWCYEPYADTGGCGAPNQSDVELAELLTEGKRAGLSVATHAIGDRALDAAVRAYVMTGARGSIEHAQVTTRESIAEMARLGLTASVQPAHLLDDHEVTDRVWAGQADRCFTLRDLLDHGVRVALGSDAPVAPLDPWLAIATAVHRGLPGAEPWHPEQAITAAEAIAASVDGRRIAVGQPGDVALLAFDPLESDAARLRGMRADLTVVAGRVVHSELPI